MANGNTKYRERYIADVVNHCSMGYTLKSFCTIAGITYATLKAWRNAYPDFDDACSVAQNTVSLFYQDLLMQKAKGGDFNAMKLMIKAVDKEDFSERVQTDVNHSITYKIDVGEVAQIVNNATLDRDIVEISEFSKHTSLNEREKLEEVSTDGGDNNGSDDGIPSLDTNSINSNSDSADIDESEEIDI